MSHFSFNCCANKSDVFAVMFEDSKITKSFSQGSTKISSDIVFGRESVDKVKYCSVSLDEPYSRIMKKGQMDILVRFWDSDKDCTN